MNVDDDRYVAPSAARDPYFWLIRSVQGDCGRRRRRRGGQLSAISHSLASLRFGRRGATTRCRARCGAASSSPSPRPRRRRAALSRRGLDAAGRHAPRLAAAPSSASAPENCGVDCSTLSQAWDHFSQFLRPAASGTPTAPRRPTCAPRATSTPPAPAPIVKAWTGVHIAVPRADVAAERDRAQWLMDFAEWDLGAPGDGVGGLGGAAPTQTQQPDNGARRFVAGKLQPWTGQALPTQIFLPSAAPTGAAETGLRPVILYFHGGNDGPWEAIASRASRVASSRTRRSRRSSRSSRSCRAPSAPPTARWCPLATCCTPTGGRASARSASRRGCCCGSTSSSAPRWSGLAATRSASS